MADKLDLNSIIQVPFPIDQYYQEKTDKHQIVIHHTVSGAGVSGDINWWESTPERVGAPFIIDRNGQISQLFSSNFWTNHLGVKAEFLKSRGYSDYGKRNLMLNKQSIGIEVDSWGGLVVGKDKLYYPAAWDIVSKKFIPNTKVKGLGKENVQVLSKAFRGFSAFEKYTVSQIESLRQLIVFLGEKFNIPLSYNPDMFDVSKNALDGKAGIYGHVCYRADKSDPFMDETLVEMLKSIK